MQAKRTLGRRLAVFVLTILTAVYMDASLCFAQSMVGANGEITEIVVGHNTKGPYTLSWTDIDPRSVSITLDSRTLKNGEDYNIDTAKGMIAFDRIVVQDALVRVSYKTTPGKSKANSGNMNIPVSLDLVSRQDTNLSITGLYAQGDPKKPDTTKTIVGIGAGKTWGATKINSQFMVSQQNADGKSNDQASSWDKTVMKLGSETKLGGLTLSGNFAHAGNSFGGAKEYKTDVGKDAMDMAAAFSSGKYLQTSFKFKKNDDATAAGKGAYSQSSEQSINLSPTGSTRMSFVRNSSETGNNAGLGKLTDVTSMRIDQKFTDKTIATATMDDSKTMTGTKLEEIQSRVFSLKSTQITGLNIEASAAQKNTAAAGEERTMMANVASDAGKKISWTAGIANSDSKKGFVTSNNYGLRFADKLMQMQFKSSQSSQVGKETYERGVLLTSAFIGKSKLTADYTDKGINDKQDTSLGFAIDVSPIAGMGLAMSHRTSTFSNSARTIDYNMLRIAQSFGNKTDATVSIQSTNVVDGAKTDQTTIQSVSLNTAAAPGIDVKLSTTQQQSTQSGNASSQTAGIKVAPKGVPVVLQGTGSRSQSLKNGLEQNYDASVALDPAKFFNVKAAISSTESKAKGVNGKSNVSLSLKSSFAEVSASMTGTTQNDKQQYQRVVNLISLPFAFAKFTAQFQQNGVNQSDDVTKSAVIELAPLARTKLSTGLRCIEKGNSVLTIHDYGAESNLWNLFTFKGSMRDRQLQDGVAPDSKNVMIALKPTTGFAITGEYTENPEDVKTGAVQPVNTTGLGVNMKLGSVGVSSNYTSKEEYQVNRMSDECKLGFEVPAFGGGKLTTGVALSRMMSASDTMTRTYSLGFKRDMGSDFNLVFSGFYSQSLQDNVLLDDKTETGVQATFGMKW